MGKDEYVVQKIVSVRASASTGAPEFLIRWKGYTEGDDTWEPVDHLEKMRGSCAKYLLMHGYKPNLDLLERDGECEIAEEPEEEEPKLKKKPKKESGGYIQVAKPSAQKPAASKGPKANTYSHLPLKDRAKPADPPKTPTEVQDSVPEKTPDTKPTETVTKKNPVVLRELLSKPIKPIPIEANEGFKTPAKKQPEIIKPQPIAPSALPTKPTVPAEASKPLFSGLRLRSADWEIDRPVKVIGCRPAAEGIEYCVQFAAEEGVLPNYKIVSHQELLKNAKWLFSRFFIDNHQLMQ